MKRTLATLTVTLTALLATAGLAGCSSSSTDSAKDAGKDDSSSSSSQDDSGTSKASNGSGYDPDDVAEQILQAQQAKTPDLEVTDGQCPGDVELEEGASFECTLVIAGVTAPYTVTVSDVDDEDGNLQFEPAKAIVSTSIAVQFIEDQASQQGAEGVTADCGEAAVIVQDAGTTFPCVATMAGQTQDVAIEIRDTDGTIGFAA